MSQVSETVIGGRPAKVQFVRVQHRNKAHGWYNRALVRFTDTNECHSMGAAEYVKWSRKLDRAALTQ